MSFIRKRIKNGQIYLEEVETIRIDGKVYQKFIRHLGKEVSGKKIITTDTESLRIDDVKVYGPLLILNQAANDLNLKNIFKKYYDEIISLVFAHCLEPKSINKIEDWFSRSDLNALLELSNLTETKIYNTLDFLSSIDIDCTQKEIYNEAKKKLNLLGGGVIYDVTNTHMYSQKCPLAKIGKDKRGVRNSKVIQIGLGVTKEEGFPVFHKIFSGNIHDSKTLNSLIDNFKKMDFSKGIVVFDRGITSEENMIELKNIGWSTLCGLASNSRLKKMLENIKKETLCVFKNRVCLKSTVFYVYSDDYKIGAVEGKIFICFDEKKAKDKRDERFRQIEISKNSYSNLTKKIKIKSSFLWPNGTIKKNLLFEKERFDGYSFIFSTNKKMKKEDAIRMYFTDKDLVEKSFRTIKGVTGLRPIRHWLLERVKAHVMICYLSYVLLSYLNIKLKKKEIGVLTALDELDSAYKIYLRDTKRGFSISKIVCLTKKQEDILKCINKKLINLEL